MDLVAQAVGRRWAATRDLGDALEHLGVIAVVRAAEGAGQADALEDQLFAFERLVTDNPELRDPVAVEAFQRITSAYRSRLVAEVRVARELSDADAQRLAGSLARQYGRPVHLNVVVDPEVLGGIRVEIGDDVIDGTVASRLEEARRKLAG